jgi:hypothetical protein
VHAFAEPASKIARDNHGIIHAVADIISPKIR